MKTYQVQIKGNTIGIDQKSLEDILFVLKSLRSSDGKLLHLTFKEALTVVHKFVTEKQSGI
jgi:hypothetical protein